jgi:hypothetical protein
MKMILLTSAINWIPINASEVLISVALTITFFLLLKPKLRVESVCYDQGNDTLRVKVINNGFFDAYNLQIEACFVNKQTGNTRHMDTLDNSFLILPSCKRKPDENKTFLFDMPVVIQGNAEPDNYIQEVQRGERYIRIRVHSCHSLSGFGKSEERIFTSI